MSTHEMFLHASIWVSIKLHFETANFVWSPLNLDWLQSLVTKYFFL